MLSGVPSIISQHHEYEVGDGGVMKTALKMDLRTLRTWLADQPAGTP
jgi:hypothetical protein